MPEINNDFGQTKTEPTTNNKQTIPEEIKDPWLNRGKAIENYSSILNEGKAFGSKQEYFDLCGIAAQNTDVEEEGELQAFLFQLYGREAALSLYESNISQTSYSIDYKKIESDKKVVIDSQQLTNIVGLIPENISGYPSRDIVTKLLAFSITDKFNYAQQRRLITYDKASIAAGRCGVLSTEITNNLDSAMPNLNIFQIHVEMPCVTDARPPYVAIMDQHNLFAIEFQKDEQNLVLLVDPTVAQMDANDIDLEFTVIPQADYKDYVQLRYGGFPYEGDSIKEYRKTKIDQSVLDSITINE